MYKKLCFLTSLVLLLGLISSFSVASAAEPIHRYSFVDGDTNAVDSVGGKDGTITGGAEITGNQLDCGGIGAVNLPPDILDPCLTSVTIEVWFTINDDDTWQRVFDFGETNGLDGGNTLFYTPTSGPGDSRFVIGTNGLPSWQTGEEVAETTPEVAPDTPTHIACVYDEVGPELRLYHDGALMATEPVSDPPHNLSKVARMYAYIGDSVYPDPYLDGVVDEFRIYDVALTGPEVNDSYNAGPNPGKAYDPDPAYGEQIRVTSLTLSWTPGTDANTHDVYFGSDLNTIHDANRDNEMGVLVSKDQDPNTYDVSGLMAGTTYYWRIDEVNGATIVSGDIWNFMVMPLKAYNPSPIDGIKYRDLEVDLAWSPGFMAENHDIYFGTDETAVTNATRASHPGLLDYVQDHNVTSYDPGLLEYDTTYYWRIDEINDACDASPWVGDVWSFTTEPDIPQSDPNLLGWWKFDEGSGTVAPDWSGNDKHGTILGGASWISGMLQGGLEFDGTDDYVELPIGEDINNLTSFTIATWVNFSNEGGSWQRIFDFGNDTNEYIFLTPRMGMGGDMRFAITTNSNAGEDQVDGLDTLASGWHHVAVMLDANNLPYILTLYLDGAEVGENINGDVLPSALGATVNNWLGRSQWEADGYLQGSLDDFRIYNKVLTEQELRQLVSPPWAWIPNPLDNATDVKVLPKPLLTWFPGQYADKHDVYFGTDFNDVNGATRDVNLGVLVSQNQDACSYDPPVIDFDTTYYWRIDEVNMSFDPNMFRGDVWTFTTANYIEIDNFDRYSSRDELRAVWKDGYSTYLNGSNVTISRAIDSHYPAGHEAPGSIHEGVDALQFVYDNDKDIWIYVPPGTAFNYSVAYYYSEMEATMDALECVSDWTSEDVKMLSVYFSGDPDNDIGTYEQMYIALEDSGGDIALLKYGDSNGEDVNNLLSREWTEWAIDLQEFEDANASFDITDVNKVYIGFGERFNNHTAGGSGVVYFDSIRLDWAKCVPAFAPASDLSGDCTIDLFDFIQLMDSWGAEPSTAVPIIDLKPSNYSAGTWLNTDGSLGGQFDINFFDINDMPTTGTIDGLPVVIFDGNDYLIADFNAPGSITGANDFTVIAKVFNPAVDDEEWIIMWARRGGPEGTYAGVGYGSNAEWGAAAHWQGPDLGFDGGVPATDMWHEIAVTHNGAIEKVVVDGKLNAAETKILNIWADDPIVVGSAYDEDWDPNDGIDANDFINPIFPLTASVNRIRVYDESMTQAQLEYIMTGSYSADLNDDGEVDFKDLAMLLDEWLKEVLFP